LKKFFIRGEKQIYLDLKAINAAQLIHSGVEHIDVTDLCTSCREDIFYSYRRSYVREEGPTGRQSAIACLL
jgi:copper oxidase (laccase) domain-containing protein